MNGAPSKTLGLVFTTHYCNYVWNNKTRVYDAYSIDRGRFQQSRTTRVCEGNIETKFWTLVK